MAAPALERLKAHAAKRLKTDQHFLDDYLRRELPGGLRLDAWLVPEELSLGHGSPLWDELGEGERLALNHWVYWLLYHRVTEGEVYVVRANPEVAAYLRPRAPDVADLLLREAAEEVDHIRAFARVRDHLAERHGWAGLRVPRKLGRAFGIHPAVVRRLLRWFGADYVVAYYTGRGIANHMGKAFETAMSRMEGPNAAIHRLTLLHAQDESQHMAVSRLLAACAPELAPAPPEGRLYATARAALQRAVVTCTFDQRLTRARERALSLAALRRMRALAGRSDAFLRALADAHFALEHANGVDRLQNQTMPEQNRRLLEGAALDPQARGRWARLLTAGQGPLRFLPVPSGAPTACVSAC